MREKKLKKLDVFKITMDLFDSKKESDRNIMLQVAWLYHKYGGEIQVVKPGDTSIVDEIAYMKEAKQYYTGSTSYLYTLTVRCNILEAIIEDTSLSPEQKLVKLAKIIATIS